MSVAAPTHAAVDGADAPVHSAVVDTSTPPQRGGDPGVLLVDAVEAQFAGIGAMSDDRDAARSLLVLAEDVLADWAAARGEVPTRATREGFRLLALHRQGAQDEPSFNACRETCREIAWHYNLLRPADHGDALPAGDAARTRAMMALLVRHLALFVGGKMHSARVGEFCCASRPLRQEE